MQQTEQVLLNSIRCALWGTPFEAPPDTDWNAVLREAEKQTVLGLAIGAAPPDVQRAWAGKSAAVTAAFVRVLHAQSQLVALLERNGIRTVILKGAAAAVYYPHPAQRSMGDIDYLVPLAQFDAAKELLLENGYTFDDDPRYPRHAHVGRDGVSLEQHRFFSSDGLDIEAYITDGMQHIEHRAIDGNAFPMLPKLANGLVLLAHLIQHLKTGLGLRQVIDWMLYVHTELDDAFWNAAFSKAARETGLETAAVTVTRMCQIALGLPDDISWCKKADAALCDELLRTLISSGNFNRKRGRGSAVESVTSNIARKGLFRYLQTAGEHNWKAYHRHGWLRPFAWAYQIGRYAKQGFAAKRSGGQLKEDLERGKARSALVKKLGISERR